MAKKKKRIIFVTALSTLFIISGGLTTFLVLAHQNKTEEIIVKSLDGQVSFSLGKYRVKIENFYNKLSYLYKIEFPNNEEKNDFEIKEINNSSYVINDCDLKEDSKFYCRYLDVDGYRFRVFEDSTDKTIFIEGVGMLEYSLFPDYEFIPFFCYYRPENEKRDIYSNIVSYNCSYESLNALLKQPKISDYNSFKNQVATISDKLIHFDDENNSFYIEAIVFPGMESYDTNSALNIKCYENYFEITKKIL